MRSVVLFVGMLGVLIAAAILLPSNGLTGNAVKEESCTGLGCMQLCEMGAQNSCAQGYTCCPTNWESGLCDLPRNCERLRQYSLSQSLEEYNATLQEKPLPLSADWNRFFLPLLLTVGVVLFIVAKRKDI